MKLLKKFKSFINEGFFNTFSYNVKNHVKNVLKMIRDNNGDPINYSKIADNFYKQDQSLFGVVNREKLQKLADDVMSELEKMGYVTTPDKVYGIQFDVYLPENNNSKNKRVDGLKYVRG